MSHPLVVIESTAKPGHYLHVHALAHQGDKRWTRDLHWADRFLAESNSNYRGVHGLAKRRGLEPHEYRITPLGTSDDENATPEGLPTSESLPS